MDNKTTIRLIKDDLAPNKMRVEDFTDIIVAYVDVLRSITKDRNLLPEGQSFDCAITGIYPGSIVAEMVGIGESDTVVFEAVNDFLDHVDHSDFHSYSRTTKEKIREFSKILKKQEVKAEISWENNLAEIEFSKLVIPPISVEGRTYLYGELVTIGGRDPNIHIDLPEYGKLMKCSASRDIIQKLSNRIYTVIGVSGIATYDLQTMELTDFTVEDILPYDESKREESFKRLGELISKHFPSDISRDED